MVLLDEEPASNETLPELPRVKSKLLVLANQALAISLGFRLGLKALALRSASVEMVTGDEY